MYLCTKHCLVQWLWAVGTLIQISSLPWTHQGEDRHTYKQVGTGFFLAVKWELLLPLFPSCADTKHSLGIKFWSPTHSSPLNFRDTLWFSSSSAQHAVALSGWRLLDVTWHHDVTSRGSGSGGCSFSIWLLSSFLFLWRLKRRKQSGSQIEKLRTEHEDWIWTQEAAGPLARSHFMAAPSGLAPRMDHSLPLPYLLCYC